MRLESTLQLLSYVSETRKEIIRNGTGSVSSRLALPLTSWCIMIEQDMEVEGGKRERWICFKEVGRWKG